MDRPYGQAGKGIRKRSRLGEALAEEVLVAAIAPELTRQAVALHLSNSQRLKLQAQKIVEILLAGTGTQGGAAVYYGPQPGYYGPGWGGYGGW